MQQTFTNALGSTTPYTVENVKAAINTLNNKRKERLMLVFDYIEDQGENYLVYLAYDANKPTNPASFKPVARCAKPLSVVTTFELILVPRAHNPSGPGCSKGD